MTTFAHMPRRVFLRHLGLAGLGGLLAACTAAPPVPTAAPPRAAPDRLAPLDPPVTVRVGQTVALSEAGQFIALERGYFHEQGLEIQFSRFNSGAQMTPLLATGQLDLGTGGVGAGMFNAIARDIPIRVAGPQARHFPGASGVYFMLRQDLSDGGIVQDYGDLRGRKVGLNTRDSAPEFGLAAALQQGGLSLDDVQVVELSFEDMIGAFATRAIDAAIQNEPAATQAETRGLASKWREMGAASPGIQFTVVLYSPDFARQEAARRWMLAYLRGVRDYNDAFVKQRGRDAVVDILTRYTPVTDPALYARMGYAYIDPDGRVDRPSLAEQLEWYVQRGRVTGRVNLDDAVDPSFAEFAVQRLGPYAA